MTRKKLTGNEPLTLRDIKVLRLAGRGRVRRTLSGKTLLDPARPGGLAMPVDVRPLLAHHLMDQVQRGDPYKPNEAGQGRLAAEDARPSEYPTPTGTAGNVSTYLP